MREHRFSSLEVLGETEKQKGKQFRKTVHAKWRKERWNLMALPMSLDGE
jgi:hypothetical protein